MNGLRLFAVALILVVATVAWVVLGGSVEFRTHDVGQEGTEQVGQLWGSAQIQQAPRFFSANRQLALRGSNVTADFELEQRKRGLLWYATYTVDFAGAYTVENVSAEEVVAEMSLVFPSPDGVYDGFGVTVDGTEVPVTYGEGSAHAKFPIPAGSSVEVATGYRTQGQDEWRYSATEGVSVIENFTLVMTTDFEQIDFPTDTVSPTAKERDGAGWILTWDYERLVSGRQIGLIMPVPLNPGPVASRISYFAPVSLLFYFAALVLLMATRRVRIHPMNFAFLAAGFFAFHLLFAYLVDRVDIYVAFAIASVVSVVLCVSYLAKAVNDRRAVLEAAVGQFVFLVLFSFSFFFEGFTGLAITIGAVLTLGYFMLRTAHLDWAEVFERDSVERTMRAAAGPGLPPVPPAPPGPTG